MTDRLTKFSNPDDLAFERQNLCHRAQGDGWWRWEITASGSLVRRLWDIVSRWEPPFLLLYLLVVSRGEPEGRYESPELASRQEVENFLAEFWDFLEADGRHNLWIRSEGSKAFVVLSVTTARRRIACASWSSAVTSGSWSLGSGSTTA